MTPRSHALPPVTDTRRSALLDRARSGEAWDIIIIGGGATGLGAAVDAAARGFRTLLLEELDFAKGTSSRATKLAHGGVRYLAQGDVSLVVNALRERGRMFHNAPHLAHPLPLVLPAYTWWSQPLYGPGLLAYSILAGRLGVGMARIIGKAEALHRGTQLAERALFQLADPLGGHTVTGRELVQRGLVVAHLHVVQQFLHAPGHALGRFLYGTLGHMAHVAAVLLRAGFPGEQVVQ